MEWVFSLFPRLREREWQAGGTLSGGEQQMLAVGRALMSRPKVMMMDEPSLGLAPLVVREIFRIIEEVNKKGVTILLIEQNANMALKTADMGYVMETGRVTMSGPGQELLVIAHPIFIPQINSEQNKTGEFSKAQDVAIDARTGKK